MLMYAVRHGESTANRFHVHSGWDDVPLTETGMKEAEKVKEKLESIHFDRVYCSDLIRARQTLEISLPGVPYSVDPRLREYHVGCLMKKTREECLREYGDSYLKNVQNRDFSVYGGENRDMLRQRAESFLSGLEENDEQVIAVFTHDGMIRAFLDISLGARIPFLRADCPNGCVSIFRKADQEWFLSEWNK